MSDLTGLDAAPLTRRSMVRATDSTFPGESAARAIAPTYDEHWLQHLLFRHPELVLLEQMESGAGEVMPLCRELPIPRIGGTVFLDMLGVTRTGRLVLVECKLWRNPQARREVVAQILEYAALLRRWSFGDLTARLKQKLDSSAANPAYLEARKRWPCLDEAAFVDGLSRSLEFGDFHLIIAGDGIRSDLQAVTAHLNAQGVGLARLSLLEIQLWTDTSGMTLVIPHVPLRTEVIQQRVLVAQSGVPLEFEDQAASVPSTENGMERRVDPDQASRRSGNRVFWNRFIEAIRFDHPDQSPPRHGGDNWIKIDLPDPVRWLTAFRSTGPKAEVGLFVKLGGDDGQALFDELVVDLPGLCEEAKLDLIARLRGSEPFEAEIGVFRPRATFANDDEQIAWLTRSANRFVTMIRPRLSMLAEAAE